MQEPVMMRRTRERMHQTPCGVVFGFCGGAERLKARRGFITIILPCGAVSLRIVMWDGEMQALALELLSDTGLECVGTGICGGIAGGGESREAVGNGLFRAVDSSDNEIFVSATVVRI